MKYLHIHVNSHIIYNSQDMETSSVHSLMNDNIYIYIYFFFLMKCYSAIKRRESTIDETWVDLEDIMLNEINHTEKAK